MVRCLSRHAAFDQARFCGRLDDASLAGPARILGSACDKHAELGGHDIQPFADVFADDVALSATAAGHIFWCNQLFNTRQVLWQDATTAVGF